MEDARVDALLADLELTKQEEGILRHLAGHARPAPKGFWGRALGAPLSTLKTGEALLILGGVVLITSMILYLFVFQWPELRDVLVLIALVLGCSTAVVRQGHSDRLSLKLYRALEKARASAPEIRPEPPHAGTPDDWMDRPVPR